MSRSTVSGLRSITTVGMLTPLVADSARTRLVNSLVTTSTTGRPRADRVIAS